jgi:hypothetical protein
MTILRAHHKLQDFRKQLKSEIMKSAIQQIWQEFPALVQVFTGEGRSFMVASDIVENIKSPAPVP